MPLDRLVRIRSAGRPSGGDSPAPRDRSLAARFRRPAEANRGRFRQRRGVPAFAVVLAALAAGFAPGETSAEANGAAPGTPSPISNAAGTAQGSLPVLSIDSPAVTEGDDGSVNLVFTVTLSSASTQQVTVAYADAGTGTATSGTDYTEVPGSTLTFGAGQTSRTITVSVSGDTAEESDETVLVTLSGAANATIGTSTGTGTITDDDTPTLSIDSPSVTEGDSGSADLTFTVTLSPTHDRTVAVGYAVVGGTATSGTDYEALTPGALNFLAGETTKTVTVRVTGDTDDEPHETVVVRLNGAVFAVIGDALGTGTIVDDDGESSLSISSPTVTEGDTGSADLTFTVSLRPASTKVVTVDFADAGTGTAASGTDYTALTSGTLTFTIGQTSRTITVSVTGDTAAETSETVLVTLSGAVNAGIDTATGTGTITDDDGSSLSIGSMRVTEGDGGSVEMRFSVTLSPRSAQRVTVDYADAGTGTATSGTDYTAITAGTLTFEPGDTGRTITVSVTGDLEDESTETVVVQLSNAVNASIATATATGQIGDDDIASLSIDSPSVTEGNSGSVDLVYTVELDQTSWREVRANYADAGTGTATSGTDYTALPSGTLTFAVGETRKTITVSVRGDTAAESDETVVVRLSNAGVGYPAEIGTAEGTGTIRDDDTPTLSIGSASVAEGDSGPTSLALPVTLSPASAQQVTVDYADAGTGTATSGTDYASIDSGTLTFAANETSKTIPISVTGDTTPESDETVVVRLSNAGSTPIGTAEGTGTITNDDGPTVSIGSASVTEGDGGAADLVFTVSLSAASAHRVTVDYADAGTGTAASGTDYTAIPSGTLTFAAQETSKTITVSVTGDTAAELDETVVVLLSGATNAVIGTAAGTGTITDDDTPTLSIDSPRVTEGDSGSVNLTFTVTLSAAAAREVTVAYADAGTGTAASGTDYDALSPGTLTFAVGDTGRTITVSVNGDTAPEPNETVLVTLSGASGASIAAATGTGTITNDDGPTLEIASTSVAEGDGGAADLVFTVSLTETSTRTITVDYADAGTGTATSGTDYTAIPSGTLTFTAGESSKPITVRVRGDTADEPDETVVVSLSGAVNATIGTATETGTITDDDVPVLAIGSPSAAEGDSGRAALTWEVTLDRESWQQVTVDYAEGAGGTATSGADYEALGSGTLTFAAGDLVQRITVSITGDTAEESDETVVVSLSGAVNATIGTAAGTGTITDDDTPTLSISSPSVTEGNGGAVNLTFTVTLSPTSTEQVTVAYADAGSGSATSGTDYRTLAPGTLTFAPGDATKEVTVSVTGDTTGEPDETVLVSLSAATNARIGTATGTGTITDDDSPAVSIESVSVDEGDSGRTNLVFPVTLSRAAAQEIQVAYADSGIGTATTGTDYRTLSPGTLTFGIGETRETITVEVIGDTTPESNETVEVVLTGVNAPIRTGAAIGTITNDDGPTVSIGAASALEGDSGSANLTFPVTLSASSAQQVTVAYEDAGTGTAASGTDYRALDRGTLTFAPGETSRTITVTVSGDTTTEPDETVLVSLTEAAFAVIGTATGTGTITNDDGPTLSIDSPRVAEGDSATANLVFTVTLSEASAAEVRVTYTDGGGTATPGTDYTSFASNTLTFAPSETTGTITVSVTGDTTAEPNETVVVTLSGAAGAVIATATGTGTIANDDGPTVSIGSASVAEGDRGSVDLALPVTLGAASAQQVTVAYEDAGTGTATSGTDYRALDAGTLTFAPGDTSKTIPVSVTGDTTNEPDETVLVSLTEAAYAVIGTATGTGTITNDDAPTLSIDSPSVAEGDSASANLTFTVTLSAASAAEVRVAYADAATGTATAGTDYTRFSPTTLTFAPGDTSKTFTVSVTGDTAVEPDETVVVTLSGALGAAIAAATGTGTITNDDGPTVSIGSPSVAEGDSGSANLAFPVTLSAASAQQVTVAYADAGTGTAASGTDYRALGPGTLTFLPGATSATITVTVNGDTTEEEDETVLVSLSDARYAVLGTATGTGTITDDDTPILSMDSPTVAEGDSGSVDLTYTVTLAPTSAERVTVAYADAGGGTATSGTDYRTLSPGTLTFEPNQSSREITVSVTGDTASEPSETVLVTLSGATNARIGTATGTGTITDDDVPSLSIGSPSVAEGDSATTNLVFTVSLDRASWQEVTVSYRDSRTGTATRGTDYTEPPPGTLTFGVGDTSKTITVLVSGDTASEPNETVLVTLSGASGATIGTATGTGTITDDDAPSLSIDSPTVTEGDSGAVDLVFTVSLSRASWQEVTVDYADAGTGTATSGTDYTAITAGTLTFTAGDTSETITVSVRGGPTDEDDETILVTLSGASGATISAATGTGTITDDDDPPSLSIDSPTVTEGDAGAVAMTFTVRLDAASAKRVTVDYADARTGTAASGTDYRALPSGTLTFGPGLVSDTITVSVTGDATDENDETILVSLSGAVNATIGTATGTGTITDDDGEPTLFLAAPLPVTEGDRGTVDLNFRVTLSAASGKQVTVNYADDIGAGGATSGTDYTALPSGTLTFAPGDTAKTITVTVIGDATDESNETVLLRLSGAVNAAIGGTGGASGEITDDDGPPTVTLALSPGSIPESGTGNSAAVTASLNHPSAWDTRVTVTAAAGANADSGDFTVTGDRRLTIAAGETGSAGTVTITAVDNGTDEPDKSVRVSGSAINSGGAANPSAVTLTIRDDDAAPTVTLALSRTVVAESGAANSATVTASLNRASSAETTVTVAAAPSANAVSGDFTVTANRTLTIAAGATASTGTVTITAVDDSVDGADKKVRVSGTASNRQGITHPAGVTLTIADDEGDPSLSIGAASVTEGHGGSANLTFTARLSPAAAQEVTVDYAEGAGGTATSGTDYTALIAGTLTFAAGDTAKTITVSVTGDTADEPNETVVVTLSGAVGAVIGTATGTGTIHDDDDAPSLSIDSPAATEGNAGPTNLVFTVRLDAASGKRVTVDYADTDSGTATSNTDYTAVTGGTLTFAAGDTSKTVTVSITGDTTSEPDETVLLELSNAGNAVVGTARGTGTIEDDDGTPTASLALSRTSIAESGAANSAAVTASLNRASSRRTTITVSAAAGTGAKASDFTLGGDAELTIAAGATSSTGTVTITAVDNRRDDPSRSVTVSGTAANGLGITQPSDVTLTITDDDSAPTLSIDSPSVSEGDGSSMTLAFTVSLDAASGRQVTVDYADAGTGTATSATDYTALAAGTLTFAAGETSRRIAVSVTGDTEDEPNETVRVWLTNAVNAVVGSGAGTGTGTITDDDPAPKVSLALSRTLITESGATNHAAVTASLDRTSSVATTITVAAAPGTNAVSGDFTLGSPATLSIAAGTTKEPGNGDAHRGGQRRGRPGQAGHRFGDGVERPGDHAAVGGYADDRGRRRRAVALHRRGERYRG